MIRKAEISSTKDLAARLCEAKEFVVLMNTREGTQSAVSTDSYESLAQILVNVFSSHPYLGAVAKAALEYIDELKKEQDGE
jgi:hypothetical protein